MSIVGEIYEADNDKLRAENERLRAKVDDLEIVNERGRQQIQDYSDMAEIDFARSALTGILSGLLGTKDGQEAYMLMKKTKSSEIWWEGISMDALDAAAAMLKEWKRRKEGKE